MANDTIYPVGYVDNITDQIIAIERTVSNRRLREAILGTDNGWLAATEAKIADLRNKQQNNGNGGNNGTV